MADLLALSRPRGGVLSLNEVKKEGIVDRTVERWAGTGNEVDAGKRFKESAIQRRVRFP